MKNIIVTGATGNLGTEVVRTLHDKGHRVHGTVGGAMPPTEMMDMFQSARQVDLIDAGASQEYVEALIGENKKLDAAVMLVGGFAAGSIETTDLAAIDKQIALNFKTAYNIVRPMMAHFEKTGGGQFIFVGARPALNAQSGKDLLAYSLGKSLVFQLAEIVNAEGKGKRISATVIVPSTIDTHPNRQAMPDADFTKWVKASDLAEAIAFVLSETGGNLREGVLKMYNES
ncbi:MAG: SDR family NAD(P)-dependent oxidoreductase [Saprospiraceae bacterium]